MTRADLLPKTFEGAIYKLTEECGELLQAIGKLQRFGKTATDPITGIRYDNWGAVQDEMADVQEAIMKARRFSTLTISKGHQE